MPATRNLDQWLEKPANGKRKRTAVVDYTDDVSDKENVDEKIQPARKRPAKKSTATKATGTAKNTTAAKPKTSNDVKDAKKLYTETLKAIDKGIDQLDKKHIATSTADYAISAAKHLATANKLAAMDPILAFNLLRSMADASHTDLDAFPKMCGEPGDASIPTFKELDQALLPLIEARGAPSARAKELATVPHRWAWDDADVGPFKTGWPNAQQRNQMYRQKLA